MRHLLLLMSMIGTWSLCGQESDMTKSIIEDAIALSEYLTALDQGKTIAQFEPTSDSLFQSEYIPILIKYTGKPEDIKTIDELLDAFEGNPFMARENSTPQPVIAIREPFVILDTLQGLIFFNPVYPTLTGSEGTQPGAPGSVVTNLADGLAKFLVKRTKEELKVAFFKKFKNKLIENEYLKSLFPQTSQVLDLIDREIYQYKAYMESLKDVFLKDLKTLPTQFKSVLQDDRLIKTDRERIIVLDLLSVGEMMLSDFTHPIFILDYLGKNSYLQRLDQFDGLDAQQKVTLNDLAQGFKLANFISSSFHYASFEERWVPGWLSDDLTSDQNVFYIYLALAWQANPDIRFSTGTTFRDALTVLYNISNKAEQMKREVIHFAKTADDVHNEFKLRNSLIGEPYENHFGLLHNIVELVGSGMRMKKLLFGFSEDQVAEDTRWTRLIIQFNDFQYNIRQKNYSSSVNNVASILGELLNDQDFGFKGDLLRYGNFMANVAKARTSDEVAAAIEDIALPVGSSITKKYADFSVSLNAYTGLGFGSEYLQSDEGINTYTHDAFLAVSAPVGIGFNFGLERAGSIGLFTSLIDVGAIAAYRFNDANSADLPALNIKNILAPGAYLVYGFGADLPLSLGLGAQLGPNLREVGDPVNGMATAETRFGEGWRWGCFLAVDIPLVNFYVR